MQCSYDAWGKILSISGPMADTLGAINPLTYRGYVYDSETDLYYLIPMRSTIIQILGSEQLIGLGTSHELAPTRQGRLNGEYHNFSSAQFLSLYT